MTNVAKGIKGFVPSPLSDRFWAKVQCGSGCWPWLGSTDGRYGELWVNGRKQKAHRVSWMLHYGEIPGGIDVLHRCDNPPCVHPGHLFLGTAKDNAGPTTGKHLNAIDGGSLDRKKARVDGATFERMLSEATEPAAVDTRAAR